MPQVHNGSGKCTDKARPASGISRPRYGQCRGKDYPGTEGKPCRLPGGDRVRAHGRLVHYSGDAARTNLSDYLSSRLNRDYGYLSRLFSEISGTTIEKYFIAQKIERAKELLAYGELSLGEIADELGYSSAAYLSSQFKSVTGLTPSHFRTMKGSRRKAIDKV